MQLTPEEVQEKLVIGNAKVINIINQRGYQHSIMFLTEHKEVILCCHYPTGLIYTSEGIVGEKWDEKGNYLLK